MSPGPWVRPIVDHVEYSATRLPQGIELMIRRHVTTFVRETIPDGQMAGMIGHRPVPHVEEFTFAIPAGQAERLVEELRAALS